MAGEEFGGGVQYYVGAQGERSLAVGCGEGIVHHQPAVVLVGEIGHHSQVHDGHHRVGGGFGVGHHGLRVGVEGRLPPLRGHILHPDHIDAQPGGQLVEQDKGAAVDGALGDDGLSYAHPAQHRGGDGVHPGGVYSASDEVVLIGVGPLAEQVQPFKEGVLAGQLIQVGIVGASIDIAGGLPTENRGSGRYVRDAEGGGLVDGGDVGVERVLAFVGMVDQSAQAVVEGRFWHRFLRL